ncbi:type II secretion system protein [candidate division KSB1 bacterium]|nr:type II secretion system protein [candidate division KSB1 bacterium]
MRLRSEESGFTLVELVIMVMILGVTLIPLTSLSISNIRTSGKQIELTRGVMYTEEAIEYVWSFYGNTNLNKGFNGIIDGYLDFAGSGLNDDLETGYSRTYSVSATQTLDGVDFIDVTVTVNCPNAGTIQMTARLTDLT